MQYRYQSMLSEHAIKHKDNKDKDCFEFRKKPK